MLGWTLIGIGSALSVVVMGLLAIRIAARSPRQHYPTVFAIKLEDGTLWQHGKHLARPAALVTLERVKQTNAGAKLVVVK